MNQKQIDELADQLREIYRTNDGPRILHDIMREFPYLRRVWNEPRGSKKPGGWGLLATSVVIPR